VRCAPPDNKPTPDERDTCAPFLSRELTVLEPAVVVCLGAFGYAAACRHYGVRPRPAFGHGVDVAVPGGPTLLCSYHPSQQNTFTGKLTEAMLDDVITRAAAVLR
jgi:uracil-DNA glycosylase family 4